MTPAAALFEAARQARPTPVVATPLDSARLVFEAALDAALARHLKLLTKLP
jgi:hypothetical protein